MPWHEFPCLLHRKRMTAENETVIIKVDFVSVRREDFQRVKEKMTEKIVRKRRGTMSIGIQVIVGMCIALAVVCLLMVFHRKQRIVWASVFVLLGIVTVLAGIFFPDGSGKDGRDKAASTENLPDTYIGLAYGFMGEGAYEDAEIFLESYLSSCVYDDTYLLARARLYGLQENYDGAEGLYRMLLDKKSEAAGEKELEEELEEVKEAKKKATADAVEDVQSLLREAASECAAKFDGTEDAVAYYLAVQEEGADNKKTEEMPEGGVFTLREMKLARMHGQIQEEDYEEIAQEMSDWEDSSQLLVFSELYRQGLISTSMLRKNEELKAKTEQAQQALAWVEKQEKDYTYTGEDKKLIDQTVKQLEKASDDGEDAYDFWVRDRLLETAGEEEEREPSKLYMQASRLAYENGDQTSADSCLEKALDTAAKSEDDAYRGPAGELNRILSEKEDKEQLKEIDTYAQLTVDHIVPIAGHAKDTDSQEKSLQDTDSQENFPQDTDDRENSPQDADRKEDFTQYVTDTVNQKAASVSISGIDAKEFETVRAVVSLEEGIADSEGKFRENVEILDCGAVISDYQVTKQEYDTVNIVLCCDNSSSMEGEKIENLKQAVSIFVGKIADEVNIGIVPFGSGVLEGVCEPGSSKEELEQSVESFRADSGTNIYSGVEYTLSMLGKEKDALNLAVIMSDGNDSIPSEEQIQQITSACESGNILLYSMGLGADVNSEVLNTYSDAGNGEYVFVSDSNSLYSFYQYIYQISKNRYEIEYQAVDTMTQSRTLRAECKGNTKAYDERPYYLYESDLTEEDLGMQEDLQIQDMVFYGLDTKLLYESAAPQKVRLTGKDLKKENEISVSLHGAMEYDLECKYESDTSWEVTIPARAACGVYDVYVTANGERRVFPSGLVITSGNLNTVRYGNYVFTSTGKEVCGDTTKLTGYIRMNGWLGFQDSVRLEGDLEKDAEVTMRCRRSYVEYDRNTAEGYAKHLAEYGMYASLPGFSEMTLYNDPLTDASSSDYPVKPAVSNGAFVLQDFSRIDYATIALYPNQAVIGFDSVQTGLPFQDDVLKTAESESPFAFQFDHEEQIILNEKQIGCDISLSLGKEDQKNYHALFGNMPIACNLGTAELKLNTLSGDVSVKVLVNVAMLCDGMGLELQWKDWKLDGVELYADYPVNTTISGIPVTFSKFSLGAEEISSIDKLDNRELLKLKYKGSFKVAVAQVSAFKPGLEKWVGDVSLASLDRVSMEFQLSRKYISVAATAKLLEAVQIGDCTLEFGEGISYTNMLLGMQGETVNGFRGEVGVGIKMQTNNCMFNVRGAAEFAMTDKVWGIGATGELEAKVSWWIFDMQTQAKGQGFVGVYEQHNGVWAFGLHGQTSDPDDDGVHLVWAADNPELSGKTLS